MSSRRTLVELTLLYAAEGLPYGFFAQALPVLFRQQGASLSKVGLLGLLYLPWALKPLWAPLVDTLHIRALGRRRCWIVLTQAALIIALLIAAVTTDGNAMHLLPFVLL